MSYPGTVSKLANSNGSTSNGSRTIYVVIDGKRVSLNHASARVVALNAHLLAVGEPQRTEMIAEAQRAGINVSSIAGVSNAGTVA
jgi:hypothetical protein